MDFLLMLLVGIPIAGVIAAVVVQLRREARDRHLENHVGPAGPAEHLDGNIEARAAAYAAFISRGGNSLGY
ncbi:hypothetical protein [Homoserinimonas sp. A520]